MRNEVLLPFTLNWMKILTIPIGSRPSISGSLDRGHGRYVLAPGPRLRPPPEVLHTVGSPVLLDVVVFIICERGPASSV